MSRLIKWYFNRIKTYIGRPRLIVQEKPVIIDEGARCESPIFILGAHRSGTSLVRRMFNSHPDIACPPESFFMAHYVAMLDESDSQAGYVAFGYDGEAMRADLARHASALHEGFRIMQGKALWADKTPQYAMIADGIDRLFARKGRFFLVLRHPGDVVFSLMQRGWRFNDIADPFESALGYVKQSVDRMLAFEAAQPARTARIRYRQLCQDPAAELASAMAKVGLRFHPYMLEFAGRSHNFGIEDPVVRGHKTIAISKGAWRSLNRARQARLVETFGDTIVSEDYWTAGETALPPAPPVAMRIAASL